MIQSEILDHLAVDDPRVIRARKDLRLINALMNHVRILQASIIPFLEKSNPLKVLEIGSGDGVLAYKVVKKIGKVPMGSSIDFVDKASCLTDSLKLDMEQLGWSVNEHSADVFNWVEDNSGSYDVCFASLFLHHFETAELQSLFRGLSNNIKRFVCVEPRRDRFGLLGASGLRLLNCDSITLHDAKVSVRAGFHHQEISKIWNQSVSSAWNLNERRAGLFSHLFSAAEVN